MKMTIFSTPVFSKIIYWGCIIVMKFRGWKTEGSLPEKKRFVMIAAPHTSNWDLPLTLTLAFLFKIQIRWMGKEAMFRFPFRGFMKWLGGIPIDRSKKNNIVQTTIGHFKKNNDLVVAIPPEGTRDRVRFWKTGFYHVADGAGVPIVLGFIDYKRKVGGVGPLFHPTGDVDKDMLEIKKFYSKITGKYKNKTSDLAED